MGALGAPLRRLQPFKRPNDRGPGALSRRVGRVRSRVRARKVRYLSNGLSDLLETWRAQRAPKRAAARATRLLAVLAGFEIRRPKNGGLRPL